MYIKKVVVIALISLFFACLASEDLGDFYPGKISVCFSREMVGNTTGDFLIEKNDDIVVTPFGWLNALAIEYQIIDLQRKHWVKDQQWHDEGRYPMNIFSVEIKDHSQTDKLLAELSRHKDVLFAEPLAIDRSFYTPNDPYLGQQWALTKIQAYAAWDIETGSEDIIIGIVDSGVKWNHPDLAANMWINTAELPGITINWETGTITGGDGIDNDGNGKVDDIMGWDFYSSTGGGQSNNPFQNFNGSTHGTHVAGCAAAVGDNGVGVAGPAYNCKILATKHSPYNSNTTSIYNGYDGIYYMADTGAHIINCSFGGGGNSGVANTSINYAVNHGSLVVVAAGNNGTGSHSSGQDLAAVPVYPALATNAFTVANTTTNDTKASSSNYGIAVDVSAPGSSIYSTYYNSSGGNTYNNLSGTSMASPIVAGVAALLKSQDPSLTVAELKALLKDTADPIDNLNPSYTGKLGTGRVNAYSGVLAAIPALSISPLSHNFGEIEAGTVSPTATFTLSNTSETNNTVSGITLSGNQWAHFTIDTGNLPITLLPGGSSTITANFSPQTPGDKAATIQVTHLAATVPSVINLKGTATGNYHAPFYENFDTGTSLTEINWRGSLNLNSGIIANSGVQGSNAVALNVFSSSSTQSVTSPTIDCITEFSEISFAYRVVNYTTNWNNTLSATNLGENNVIYIEISTNGPTGTYTNLFTINGENHTPSTSFASLTLPISTFAEEEINIRFRPVRDSGNWFFVLDDVIVTQESTYPYPAINPSPTNGALNVSKATALAWAVAPVGSPPTGFYLYFDTVYPPVQMFTLSDVTSWTPPNQLLPNTAYYWQLVPFNLSGESTGCPIWSFFTRGIVGLPLLVGPENNSTNMSLYTTLSWLAGEGHTPASYNVQIDTVNPPVITYEGITGSPFLAPLAHGMTYYWRVQATSEDEVSDYTQVWSFSTVLAAPNPVILVAPTHTATGISITPTLEWEIDLGNIMPANVSNPFEDNEANIFARKQMGSDSRDSRTIPDYFMIHISRNSSFNPRYHEAEVSYPATTYTVPENNALLHNTLFYWRVVPGNSSGYPLNNQSFTFTTVLAPPGFAISPNSYDFGIISPGEASTNVHFQITNSGGAPLTVSNIAIEGQNANEFVLTLTDELPWSINGGATKTFYVKFSPVSWGSKTATAVVSHDAESGSNAVELSGGGVPDIDFPDLPVITALGSNYPNPFNPETVISFSLAKEGIVTVDIYNIKGQKIITLIDKNMQIGHHTMVWDGTDESGHAQSSGVYFYRMKAGDFVAIKKMILMK